MVFVVDDYKNVSCDDHHGLRDRIGIKMNESVLLVDTIHSGTFSQKCKAAPFKH